MADVGAPTAAHLAFAGAMLSKMPSDLNDEIHDPIGAVAVIYAMLLHADPSDDEPELQKLAKATDASRWSIAFAAIVAARRAPAARSAIAAGPTCR